MTEIKLYNTKTRSKDVFAPLDPGHVKMYVCGPTVYDRAHIGNARPVIVFDVLYRLLRHVYPQVTYVRNFTDVDDKINATALARKEAGAEGSLEDLVQARSDETIAWYLEDMAAVGAQDPDQMPRATKFIDQMVAMTQGLIDKGHAYAAEGHVLFRVRSYKDYGALSGRSVDDMIAGARVEVAPYKEDPMDFVLWKPSSDDLPGWDSPWGRGRPGWHIECSAMAFELLGAEFDIHGGGNDLTFPHHENEIAQSKCMGHGFANVWMHNEMLQVEGKKMSKSLGNFFTVRDLLEQGVPGEVIRFVFLSTHYRKPMDWTEKKRVEAETQLMRIYTNLHSVGFGDETFHEIYKAEGVWKPDSELVGYLSDDLNTHGALTRIRELCADIIPGSPHSMVVLASSLELLGMLPSQQRMSEIFGLQTGFNLTTLETRLNELREVAMQTKDFSALDALKSALMAAAIEVRMSKEGVELEAKPGFDPSKLEGLL